MEHRVRVSYDRAVIAEAARHFAVRSIRRDGLAAFLALLVGLGLLIASGDRSWVVGVFGTGVLVAVAFGVLMFLVPYRRSMARLEHMPSRTAELTFSEAGISTLSELGRQELSWRSVDQVWTFPRLWMIC